MSSRDLQNLSVELVGGSRRRTKPQMFGDFEEEPDSPKRKSGGSTRPSTTSGITKRRRCGECDGCRARECGTCLYCKDMPKYGGTGTMRQSCKMRQCHVILRELQAAKAELAAGREAERVERDAARQAEREAKRQEREQNRVDRRLASGDAREKAQQMAIQLSGGGPKRVGGARVPTVALEEGMDGGWGQHGCATVAS